MKKQNLGIISSLLCCGFSSMLAMNNQTPQKITLPFEPLEISLAAAKKLQQEIVKSQEAVKVKNQTTNPSPFIQVPRKNTVEVPFRPLEQFMQGNPMYGQFIVNNGKSVSLKVRNDAGLNLGEVAALIGNSEDLLNLYLGNKELLEWNVEEKGWSLLHVTAACASCEIIKALLNIGLPVNQPSTKPFHFKKFDDDKGRLFPKGATPLDIAKERGNPEIIKLLEERHAKNGSISSSNIEPIFQGENQGFENDLNEDNQLQLALDLSEEQANDEELQRAIEESLKEQ